MKGTWRVGEVLFALVIAGMAISQLIDEIANFELESEKLEGEKLFRDKASVQALAKLSCTAVSAQLAALDQPGEPLGKITGQPLFVSKKDQ